MAEPFDVISSSTTIGVSEFGRIHQFLLPNNITIRKASVYVNNVTLPDSTFLAGVYSIDGQTRYFTFGSTVNIVGLYTYNITPSVDLKAGMYYIFFVPPGGTNGVNFRGYVTSNTLNPTGESILVGSISAFTISGSPPATFDPTIMTPSIEAVAVRFN